jgi:DHA2 family multidrug resistance protein-like MFS transporter
VAGPILLPEHKDPAAGRLDVLSAALSLAGVLPVIYGIKLAAEGGNSALALTTIIVGFGIVLIFLRRQASLADPLLDLSLLTRPRVSAALTVNLLDFFVGFGILLLLAQYLQLILGLTPLQAGLWSIPAGLGSVVGALLTSPMLRLMRPAYALALGLAFGAGALGLMIYAIEAQSLILLITGATLLSIGTAPGTALVADLIVSAAPQERSGAASALSETTSEFGGALGIALLGSLATFLYRHELGRIIPGGTAADAMETALRGIGSAGSLSQGDGGGKALLSAAQSAYASAVSAAFLAGAGILLLAAVIAIMTFRRRGDTPPQAH